MTTVAVTRPRHRGYRGDDGELESGARISRGSSFRKSVSGLVRRVSQKVTRDNKGEC